ncbi:glycine-rich protein 23 [Diospyros lotus]|uniref:glycine-rich protein 23 n=1 Tax=Diospyros lotus TaxID=55363 RepID=UPI002250AE75|nr:glycine-rich protein 23 [Diospyros lotus]
MAKFRVIFLLSVLVVLGHASARNVPGSVDHQQTNTVHVPKAPAPAEGKGVKDKKCGFGFAGVGGAAGIGGVIPLGGIGGVGGVGGLGGASGLGGLGGLGGVGGLGGGIGGVGGGVGGAGGGVGGIIP